MGANGTCLVTGGAGFIGSHLSEALLAANYRVVAVDNLITGRKENLSEAQKNPNFSFVHHDVIEPLKEVNHLSYIFHLASPASVIDYQKYPEETALVNSAGTRNLLQLARDTGAKFLFASTSEVYGDHKEHPQKETYWGHVNPIGPRACYDESKRFGEMMTMVYHRMHGADGRIVRIFNTYGPRMRPDDGRVISNFVVQALRGQPLTLYGDGSQSRSFCYVDDLIDGLLRLMNSADDFCGPVNLGNPVESTVRELADEVIRLTGSRSTLRYLPLPEDDPVRRRPDITLARAELGWRPTTALEDGLRRTIDYFARVAT